MDNKYKKEFVEFLIKEQGLLFGDYTTKSGRNSPYFFNAARFNNGQTFGKFCSFFARHIHSLLREDKIVLPDFVYGPAYKGIPLAVGISIALERDFGMNTGWVFNRKEEKTHGDKGRFVGYEYKGDENLILVDDVITAGLSAQESLNMLKENGNPGVSAVIVAVDRQEKDMSGSSAVGKIRQMGFIVEPIINITQLLELLTDNQLLPMEQLERIEEYQREFCVLEE